METNIMNELRESFKKGSVLTKLIYINLGVFILVKLAYVFYFLATPASEHGMKALIFQSKYLAFLMVSSEPWMLMLRPWTLFSYMFLHFGFLHILFNILVLYWFGRIYLQYLTPKQLLTTYLLGGISGAAVFMLAYNLFPGLSEGQALGASAAIMAVVMAISFYNPSYTLYIPFIGPVKLIYIALVYVVLDVLQIASENAGGHLAHLGGAMYGYLFALQMKRGKDIGKSFSKFFDWIASLFKRKSKLRVSYKNQARHMNDFEYNKRKVDNQKEIDRILDKIAQSGYESLSKKEKDILFKMGSQS